MLRLVTISSAIGAIGALCSDYICFVRLLLIDGAESKPFVAIKDALACVCATLSVILSAYFCGGGVIRGATVLAVLLGIAIYRLTVRRAALRIFKLLNGFITIFAALMARPIAHILLKISSFFRNIREKSAKNKEKNRKKRAKTAKNVQKTVKKREKTKKKQTKKFKKRRNTDK